jgi:hypothetical protein
LAGADTAPILRPGRRGEFSGQQGALDLAGALEVGLLQSPHAEGFGDVLEVQRVDRKAVRSAMAATLRSRLRSVSVVRVPHVLTIASKAVQTSGIEPAEPNSTSSRATLVVLANS